MSDASKNSAYFSKTRLRERVYDLSLRDHLRSRAKRTPLMRPPLGLWQHPELNMNSPYVLTRRRFLQSSAIAALAASSPSWLRAAGESPYRNLVPTNRRMRIAAIGVGGKGYSDVMPCVEAGAEVVALCDVDFNRGARAFQELPLAARYRDWRQMLREMGDKIDGVIISTPDHMHFPASMMALEMGKHLYVQKPLTHTIGEARALKLAAAKAGVVTQMGNQGHANEGTRLVKEWIEGDVIGTVKEVISWTNRPVWPQAIPLPQPVAEIPPTVDWNLWLGVAPERDYSPKIHPFNWRGWWDYGCGALGDMGCHLMDAPFWALRLSGDCRVSAVSEGNTPVCGPKWSIVTYEFPRRGSLPPLKYTWYDGGKIPPRPEGVFEPDEPMPKWGTLYMGTKGVIFSEGDYSESPRLMPRARMAEFKKRPPRTHPRIPKGSPYIEWITACHGGPKPGSNIPDYSADLTEMVSLGNLAIRLGKPIQWDAARGVCVGMPEADALIHKKYRVF
jgi:predicted dehydrogenase